MLITIKIIRGWGGGDYSKQSINDTQHSSDQPVLFKKILQ